MISKIFIFLGALVLLVCVYLFCRFRRNERLEFGIVSKKISLINNIFHLLIVFFFVGYTIVLLSVDKYGASASFVAILSQILFWGAIFVAVTIMMLRIMLEYIVKAKLNQIDHLTSLNTKIAGNCKIDDFLANSKHAIYLAILDLDNFKKLNDIYGHLIGDEVLVNVAKVIKENIRTDEIACRFGGDEFVIGMFNRSEEDVIASLEKMKKGVLALATQYDQANMSVSIGLSYGVGKGAGGSNTYKEMMQNADKALYHVKKNGKNAVHVYSENGML
ncbi:MAG: GGDEF domain-containing protein [Pleomorphochaeta sp.]